MFAALNYLTHDSLHVRMSYLPVHVFIEGIRKDVHGHIESNFSLNDYLKDHTFDKKCQIHQCFVLLESGSSLKFAL